MNKKFIDLVLDQFIYGGVKYASTNVKEATDELVEDFGWNWLIGTQAKYVKRYKNTKREKDLLKIACYQYLNWLKLGYHLATLGTAEMQCTTVETKSKHFADFIRKAEAFSIHDKNFLTRHVALTSIYEGCKLLRLERAEEILIEIFALCEFVWLKDGFDQTEKHETDTWLERDGRTRTGGGSKSNG